MNTGNSYKDTLLERWSVKLHVKNNIIYIFILFLWRTLMIHAVMSSNNICALDIVLCIMQGRSFQVLKDRDG